MLSCVKHGEEEMTRNKEMKTKKRKNNNETKTNYAQDGGQGPEQRKMEKKFQWNKIKKILIAPPLFVSGARKLFSLCEECPQEMK